MRRLWGHSTSSNNDGRGDGPRLGEREGPSRVVNGHRLEALSESGQAYTKNTTRGVNAVTAPESGTKGGPSRMVAATERPGQGFLVGGRLTQKGYTRRLPTVRANISRPDLSRFRYGSR